MMAAEEPSRSRRRHRNRSPSNSSSGGGSGDNSNSSAASAPVSCTASSSGLRLTHRHRSNVEMTSLDGFGAGGTNSAACSSGHHYIAGSCGGVAPRERMLAYALYRWSIMLLGAALLLGTGIAIHHGVRHEQQQRRQQQRQQVTSADGRGPTHERSGRNSIGGVVELVHEARLAQQQRREGRELNGVVPPPPLSSAETPKMKQQQHRNHNQKRHQYQHRPKRTYAQEVVSELRLEFDSWVDRHQRSYGTEEERENRFGIWLDNHHDTLDLNERHGPCKMTGKMVFGDNHLKDLTRDEFRSQYLTGYTGPHADHVPVHRLRRTDEVMEEKMRLQIRRERDSRGVARKMGRRRKSLKTHYSRVERHPSVQERYMKYVPVTATADSTRNQAYLQKKQQQAVTSDAFQTFTVMGCKWYDFSCMLRYVFTGHILGGNMEPKYDADSYPDSIDWRDMGVVTNVHSQGNCGACWAITAVETIESVNAINTGTLVDLAESEVITCDSTCEMCDGGWPQNAYEYVAKHGGLPSDADWSYDGDWLLTLTYVMSGESNAYDQSEIYDYLYSQCPNYGQSGSGSRSGDNNNYYSAGDAASFTRYGKIEGYGYSTDKCLCYTDGSGCDCDDQNEGLAIGNVASYGPATVCLDAEVWQNYDGGILTADSGCSAGFMDMNHCVQAVGYAFVDANADGGDGDNNQNSHQSGSDDSQREGYWIIRNQWGNNWGMNGYIYVAMGDNTCGVLNDMTQVYA